ncbi:MAG: IPT/TIG domain-containing protein [Actinobacteria bacterium]|nr:IPT/TIG domain-containing protein [Actinomycetota bacterium]
MERYCSILNKSLGKISTVLIFLLLFSTSYLLIFDHKQVSAKVTRLYDEFGVPYLDYGTIEGNYIGIQRNPLTVGNVAMDEYWVGLNEGDEQSRQYFLNCAQWFIDNLVPQGDSGFLEYKFSWGYSMTPPWHSGMAQGQALKVLSRATSITGDSKYLETAEKILNSFDVEVKDGGITIKDSGDCWWYEEYACKTGTNPRVLNGMIVAMLGLYDYYQQTGSVKAKNFFDKGLVALRKDLHIYDGDNWTYYDCYERPAPTFYHHLHIEQLEDIYQITSDKYFRYYENKWKSYAFYIQYISPSSANASEELIIKGKYFGENRGSSVVKFGDTVATEYTYWSDSVIKVLAPVGVVSSDVTVTNNLGTTKGVAFTALPTYYLPEGSTEWGFDCYFTIENPNNSNVSANIHYLTNSMGEIPGGTVELGPKSQLTVHPADVLGIMDFSILVNCQEDRPLSVDRTMAWTGNGALSQEGHSSIAATTPSKTWYFPEGSSSWGFECWLLIQNPNNYEAICQVTYMNEDSTPVMVEKRVPAKSRQSFDISTDIGNRDVSMKIESSIPIISERAMYRNFRREGHDSIGAIKPSNDYYLPEGCTGYANDFETWILVQNPQDTANKVAITFFTESGMIDGPVIEMPANSRITIKASDHVGNNVDVSTKIHGEKPIVSERAMFWAADTGEACHDSIGLNEPHKSFCFPDGQTSDGVETWTLIANPNDSEVEVRISYLRPTGSDNSVFTDTIPAYSRKSYNMADRITNGRAAIMVESLTENKNILCERAMYWNNRGAGTDTIGSFSD